MQPAHLESSHIIHIYNIDMLPTLKLYLQKISQALKQSQQIKQQSNCKQLQFAISFIFSNYYQQWFDQLIIRQYIKIMINQCVEYQIGWLKQISSNHTSQQRVKYYMKLGLCQPESKLFHHKQIIDSEIQQNIEINLNINFLPEKTVEQVRKSYLNKLLSTGLLKLEPTKKHQTIMIYDWDDTILCTSYINAFRYQQIPLEVKSLIDQLDNYALKLLDKSKFYAKVFIITNATKGWVQHSSQIYLPKIYQYIKRENIEIISARALFEEQYPGDNYRWKIEAFKTIKHKFDKNIITNLICVGDSKIEMEAAHVLAKQFRQVLVKTIKMRQNPKPQQLIKQHELVYQKFEQIYIDTTNLCIKLGKKK